LKKTAGLDAGNGYTGAVFVAVLVLILWLYSMYRNEITKFKKFNFKKYLKIIENNEILI